MDNDFLVPRQGSTWNVSTVAGTTQLFAPTHAFSTTDLELLAWHFGLILRPPFAQEPSGVPNDAKSTLAIFCPAGQPPIFASAFSGMFDLQVAGGPGGVGGGGLGPGGAGGAGAGDVVESHSPVSTVKTDPATAPSTAFTRMVPTKFFGNVYLDASGEKGSVLVCANT